MTLSSKLRTAVRACMSAQTHETESICAHPVDHPIVRRAESLTLAAAEDLTTHCRAAMDALSHLRVKSTANLMPIMTAAVLAAAVLEVNEAPAPPQPIPFVTPH